MKKTMKILLVFLCIILIFSQIVFAAATYAISTLKGKYYKNNKWDFSGMTTSELEKLSEGIKGSDEYRFATTEDISGIDAGTYKNILQAINTAIENNGDDTDKINGDKSTVSTKDSKKTKLNYTADQIREYRVKYGSTTETDQEIRDKWKETLGESGTASDNLTSDGIDEDEGTTGTLYTNQPSKNDSDTAAGSLDDVIGDADSFVSSADTEGIGTVNSSALQDFSQTFYNILLSIGIVVAVIVGMIIGIKFMTSSVEEKADIKQTLVPYVAGCIVVFGGFAIWKIVVTVLQGM